MSLVIDDPQAEELARRLAARRGRPLEQVVREALLAALEGQHAEATACDASTLVEDLMEIGRRVSALPDVDTRSPDEIIGYDEYGLPR